MPDDIAMRPFEASLPMALLRAREATMRFFRPALAEHDLTEQQWRALRALSSTERALEVGEIADRTFLRAPSLSRILAHLEQRGLITRATAPHDQRRSLISLSRRGLGIVRRIAPTSEAQYEEIESRLGAAELGQLLDLLRRLERLGDEQGLEPDPRVDAP